MTSELTLSLISLAVAAALQPPQVIAMIILLQTGRSVANGLAYVSSMVAFRLLLGGLFWVSISAVEESIESGGGKFDILVGSVLLILGLLLLVYALRLFLSAQDEDQAAASWLDKLSKVSPIWAAMLGIAFLAMDPKDWLTTLAAVNLIADADLSGPASLLIYMIYILLAQLLLLIPLILVLIVPLRARGLLTALHTWMKRYERNIEIIVAIIFGLLFIYVGLADWLQI